MYETLVYAGKISVPEWREMILLKFNQVSYYHTITHKCSNKTESDFSRQIQELFPAKYTK